MSDQGIDATTIYTGIAQELQSATETLPTGTLAERFFHAMSIDLRYIVDHKDALRRMVIAGFQGEIEDVEAYMANYAQITAAFNVIVSGAVDTLTPAQVEQLTVILANFHLLFMLFVLHDRTEGNTATFHLLAFARDAFTLLRPILMIPPGAKALARLSQILVNALGW